MAGTSGLFSQHQIEVEIVDPPGGPDNIHKVAGGDRDVCLTSVHHYLTAWAQDGDLAARFVAIVVQRSPIAALVREDGPIRTLADLSGPGIRLGGSGDHNHTIEYLATLDRRGISRPQVVGLAADEARAALARGDVDALVGFVDALPRTRRLVGTPLRAIPVGLDIYASGLVAADRLSTETVGRMRAALAEALERQQRDPEGGVTELCRRYPDIVPEEAIEGWKLLEPNIFTGVEPGSMDATRWQETIEFLCAARGLAQPRAERVYRPEFATSDAPA